MVHYIKDPLFNVELIHVALNVALFNVYLPVAALLNVALFTAALFKVALF